MRRTRPRAPRPRKRTSEKSSTTGQPYPTDSGNPIISAVSLPISGGPPTPRSNSKPHKTNVRGLLRRRGLFPRSAIWEGPVAGECGSLVGGRPPRGGAREGWRTTPSERQARRRRHWWRPHRTGGGGSRVSALPFFSILVALNVHCVLFQKTRRVSDGCSC